MSASLCCFLSIGLLVVVSADKKIITAQSGQNLTLPCQAENNNINTVQWSRADLGTKYVLLFRDGHLDPDDQHPSFKNRVDLQYKKIKEGDVSLILKNVIINDTGTYECYTFQSGGNQEKPISSIYLRVDPPGQTGGSARLKVVVPVFGLLFVAVGFAV
ncbi:selection and upkeep of intraepithelial T-cells protein 7 [Oreochromis niloticus]|uniref:selection and upkeep of intraepithelial T-cells protein 7 n=1 Tax=Oreochromis niloticus TaxID=8128 RepID=UPI0003946068|nr:selection and upkeep of intraepithelial T-cells protein 7 [Oreochromis niloticus]